MLSTPLETLESRARAWVVALGEGARVQRSESAIGGGSLPGATLPTWCLALGPFTDAGAGAAAFAGALRRASPPVVGRIEQDTVLLDPRTVLPEEDDAMLAACRAALAAVLPS